VLTCSAQTCARAVAVTGPDCPRRYCRTPRRCRDSGSRSAPLPGSGPLFSTAMSVLYCRHRPGPTGTGRPPPEGRAVMSTLTIASDPQDAAAAEAVEAHHEQLAGELAGRVTMLLAAAEGDPAEAETVRAALVGFCDRDLLPHAAAEERTLYPAARDLPEARLLIDGMLAEHRRLTALVDALRTTGSPVRTAADARALQVMFEEHLEKENTLVLPLLAASSDISLAGLLAGMHELLGHEHGHSHGHEHGAEGEEAGSGGGCGGSCACGGSSAGAPTRSRWSTWSGAPRRGACCSATTERRLPHAGHRPPPPRPAPGGGGPTPRRLTPPGRPGGSGFQPGFRGQTESMSP